MEIITINYNTPDLVDNLIGSIRKIYSNPIRVIDGSDNKVLAKETRQVCLNYTGVTVDQLGYNIHHGPGMHYACMNSKHEWALIIDSDSRVKDGLLEVLRFDNPYCGFGMRVNRFGFNVPNGEILYLHPHFLLVNTWYYKSSPYKFIKHGAPALNIMLNVDDHNKSVIDDKHLALFERGGRGTVERYGYNL